LVFDHFPPKKGIFQLKSPQNYRNYIVCRALVSKKSHGKSRLRSKKSAGFSRKKPVKIHIFKHGNFHHDTPALERLGSPSISLPFTTLAAPESASINSPV